MFVYNLRSQTFFIALISILSIDSYDFQNGALDPREIGFYINNEDRLTGFIEALKEEFEISSHLLKNIRLYGSIVSDGVKKKTNEKAD